MADNMQVDLTFKKEVTDDDLEAVKKDAEKKLKMNVARVKAKGKRVTWILKVKDRAKVTSDALKGIFKKSALKKDFKDADVT